MTLALPVAVCVVEPCDLFFPFSFLFSLQGVTRPLQTVMVPLSVVGETPSTLHKFIYVADKKNGGGWLVGLDRFKVVS